MGPCKPRKLQDNIGRQIGKLVANELNSSKIKCTAKFFVFLGGEGRRFRERLFVGGGCATNNYINFSFGPSGISNFSMMK